MSQEAAPRELTPEEISAKEALRENDVEKAHTLALAADAMSENNAGTFPLGLKPEELLQTNGVEANFNNLANAYDDVQGKPTESSREQFNRESLGLEPKKAERVDDVHKAEVMAYAAAPIMDKRQEVKQELKELFEKPGEIHHTEDRDMRNFDDAHTGETEPAVQAVEVTNVEHAHNKVQYGDELPSNLREKAMDKAESTGYYYDESRKETKKLEAQEIEHADALKDLERLTGVSKEDYDSIPDVRAKLDILNVARRRRLAGVIAADAIGGKKLEELTAEDYDKLEKILYIS